MWQRIEGMIGIRWVVAVLALALAAPAGAACTVSPAVATALGTYSPAAINAAAPPAVQSRAGFACNTSLVVLLGTNYVRARFTSLNTLKLKRTGGTETFAYKASADAAGTVLFAQNGTVDYMQNNLLNLLGLLGGSSADLPIFVKPTGGSIPPVGTYTDKITIAWNWYICSGVMALGACVGTEDQGNGSTEITVTMIVAAQNVTLAMTQATTWDPTNGTSQPKALPGSKGRVSVEARNPDLVALDTGSVALVYPVPGTIGIALDGDGASSGAAIRLTEGATPSTLTFSYVDPASTTDDVDFSSNNGTSWTYIPVAGNRVSERAITTVRLRPKGAMAKQSSFAISMPFLVK